MGTIYVIENTVNGKIYIGQTGNWKIRKGNHLSSLKHGRHYNEHLQRSWDKHGPSAFTFKILVDNLPEQYMDDVERGLVATLRTMNPDYGYNRESGGNSQKIRSREAIEKSRQSRLGKKASEETKQKMRESRLGKVISDESKNKISMAHKGRKHTEETRRKFSEAQKKLHAGGYTHPMQGRKMPEGSNNRSKKIIDSEGIIWPSITSFCKVYGGRSNINRHLKSGKPYRGLTLQYYDETIQIIKEA
jgi:group I intron endonuclease